MTLLQGAYYLFRTELKRSVSSSFIVLGLIVFTLLMCAPTYLHILDATHPTLNDNIHFLADYMFVLTFGAVSVMVTFIYGGGFKRDVLADRLAYYRSMPISSEHIVLSKIIGALLTTFVALAIFFIGNLVGFVLFGELSLSSVDYAYIVHAVVLYAICIVLNYMFTWFDLCVSYKNYTIFSFIFVFLILGGTVIVSNIKVYENSIIIMVYRFSEANPLLAIAISVVVIIVTTLISYKVTTVSLKKRNLG